MLLRQLLASCALALVGSSQGFALTSAELVTTLTTSQSEYERARACQQLAIVGTPEAVPTLAALLGDAKLGHYAREPLEAMATPAADAALRAALTRLQGAQLVGVINSLGARADKDAVSALRRIAQRDDDNFPAAGSALLALARIGTPEATATVRKTLGEGPIELREAAAVAALQVGDDKAADGKLITAALWYDAVRNEAGVPKQARLAATRGAILARGDAGMPDLLEALRSGDEDMRAVGLRTIREVQGAGVLPALVAELERLPAPTRAQALSALADRVDPGVLSVVERHGRSGELEVRLAAVRALGRVGGATSLPLLLQALASRAADERDAAQRSLAVIRIPEADTTLIHALDASSGEARVKLIAILGERNAEAGTPALLRFARDPDPALRGAALRALALVARPGDIDALIRLSLEGDDDEARLLADRAIYGAAMKILDPALRAEPLVAALRATAGAGKRAALLRPLGAVVRAMGGNEAARIAVAGALHDSDAGVRTAAVKTLSDWPDATAVAPLLDYLRAQPPEPQRALALSGVVRLAANVAAGRDKTALDVGATFRAAHALVRTDPDRMQLVSGLGSLARPESLELLQPYLALAAVKTEASLAVLQIAPTLLRGKDAAATKAALARIAAEDKDADIRAQADRLLKEGPPQAAKKGKKKA